MSQNLAGAVVGSNMNFVRAALVAGTTTTITTTVATMYSIDGKIYTKGTITNGATPTTDVMTGAAFVPLPIPTSAANAKGCAFVVALNAAGDIKVAQGPLVNVADVTGGMAMYQLRMLSDSLCPFGYIIVKGSATQVATWTFGTNNLSSVTGMTYVFGNLSSLPAQPISA